MNASSLLVYAFLVTGDCLPSTEMKDVLEERFSETPVFSAVTDEGTLWQIFRTHPRYGESGWTIIQQAGEVSCVMDVGKDIVVHPEAIYDIIGEPT